MNDNYILLSHATFIYENNSQQCMKAYDYVKLLIEKILECTKLLFDILNQINHFSGVHTATQTYT